jgi:hypothetical protein
MYGRTLHYPFFLSLAKHHYNCITSLTILQELPLKNRPGYRAALVVCSVDCKHETAST